MRIKYDAYWKTDKGHTRITHGVLTDEDIEDAIKRKEDRDSVGHIPVTFDRHTIEGVDL